MQKSMMIMKTIKWAIALLGFAMFQSMQTWGQSDPMFTQYMFNEMYINPAYAGSRENVSVTGLLREQWVGLDGAPSTQTFSVHAPILGKKVGLGLTFLNESIGVSKRTGFNLNGSYRIPMDQNTLSFGLQLGVNSISESLLDLGLASDNQFQLNTGKQLAPNFGFGTYYVAPKWYLGLSIPRMIQNRLDVTTGTGAVQNKLNVKDWHYFVTAGSIHSLSTDIKLRPALLIKTVNGAPMELDLSCNVLLRDFVWVGLAYRTQDALSFLAGAQLTKQLRLGYSYDMSTSKLKDFNSGSHEIMLGYDFSFDKNKIISPRYF
jgi:type IX secretion system PorP/SprF family membrane protein